MRAEALLHKFYPESGFGGFSNVDGTMLFYQRVQALLRENDVVLDVGCGRGLNADDPVPARRLMRTLRGRCGRVIGIDVDRAGQDNSLVDEFRLIDCSRWPVGDATIDLCMADWVLEHIPDPKAFCSEVSRVVKVGGYFCARTTSRFGYVSLADKLIPSTARNAVLQRVGGNRKRHDIFPVLHRCNTPGSLYRFLSQSGFDSIVVSHEAEPSYLSFSIVPYALGVIWQRLAPKWLRNYLFIFARKIK
jgi:ubiquinone/menaquinone biosynthesis C-methylase UbiE